MNYKDLKQSYRIELARKVIHDLDYLFKHINWKDSAIDAKSAEILNNLNANIIKIATHG